MSRSVLLRPLSGLAFLCLVAPARLAAQSPSPGYSADEISIAPAGAFVGGFEVLPDDNYAVFDGTSVVELSPVDGSLVRTLFTPLNFVYGAFLTLGPDGTKLYFGESRFGKVYEIELATLNVNEVLQTVYPYDLAFDPSGRPFLSYALGFFNGSHVALCDFTNGTFDDVVDSPDASGPLAFDVAGNLYTTTPDSSWPPVPDATEVVRVSAADLASGIGPGAFAIGGGEILGNVDGGAGIALDEANDVLVSDPNSGLLVDLDAVTHAESIVASAGAFNSFLYLRHQNGTRGAFEPYQPAEAGTLLAVRSDFFSFNGVTRVQPARPVLSTTPASPIPVGSFDFSVTGGVPDGYGLMLITGGVAPDEFALHNRTWPAPLFIGLDFTGGLTIVPIATDDLGELLETVDNPGYGDVTVAFQLLVGASGAGPYYGTSAPFEVVLQ